MTETRRMDYHSLRNVLHLFTRAVRHPTNVCPAVIARALRCGHLAGEPCSYLYSIVSLVGRAKALLLLLALGLPKTIGIFFIFSVINCRSVTLTL